MTLRDWSVTPGARSRLAPLALGLILTASPTSLDAQSAVRAGSKDLRNLNVWAGSDTMLSRTRVSGEWQAPNGTGYVRTVRADAAGYALMNRWFNGSGQITAIQEYTVGPNGAWPVTVRVRAETDSASLRVDDARVVGWELPPGSGSEARLYDKVLENGALPPDLAQVMISGMSLGEGQELTLSYFTLLVPGAPLEEKARRFRVVGRDMVDVGGHVHDCWVIAGDEGGSGTRMTLWTSSAGRLIAVRGQPAGGSFEWWHVLTGADLETLAGR